MSARLDVRGKSREEIAELLKGTRRARLYELIHELATIEDHFTPQEVGLARRRPKRTIIALCKAGKIPGTHKAQANDAWRISRRGLEEWDLRTQVTPLNGDSLSH